MTVASCTRSPFYKKEKRRMNMRTTLSILPLATALLVSSCGHSGEIQEFGNDLKTVARNMKSEVDSDPSPAGVSKPITEFGNERKLLRQGGINLGRKV